MAPVCDEITLYGLTEDNYERLTGIPGSSKNACGQSASSASAVAAVAENRRRDDHHHEIPAMKRFGKRSFGVPFSSTR